MDGRRQAEKTGFQRPKVVTTTVVQQHHLVVFLGTSLEEDAGPNTPREATTSLPVDFILSISERKHTPRAATGPTGGSGRDGSYMFGDPFSCSPWSHNTPSLLDKSCDLFSLIERGSVCQLRAK